jgi:hypothetical protein
MNNARAAEAQLRIVTRVLGNVRECVRAIQIVCVQAVAIYGRKVWWDSKKIGRQQDLQLLQTRHVSSIMVNLPTTQLGPLTRYYGLAPKPVALDSRQQ